MDKHAASYLHFGFPVERSLQRFRELIIHASLKSVNDVHFGAIKLNKILYYADFLAFFRFGVPLTGQKYFRIQNGPAPKAMIPVANELANEGAIRFERVNIGGKEQIRTIALREPVLTHFSKDELLLVDEVVASLRTQTATQVSDASHDVKWKVLQHRDELPYEFAHLDPNVTEEDISRTAELAREFGW